MIQTTRILFVRSQERSCVVEHPLGVKFSACFCMSSLTKYEYDVEGWNGSLTVSLSAGDVLLGSWRYLDISS